MMKRIGEWCMRHDGGGSGVMAYGVNDVGELLNVPDWSDCLGITVVFLQTLYLLACLENGVFLYENNETSFL